jgi:sulfhydrogenase subunit alpha
VNPETRTLQVGALTRVEGEGALRVKLTDGAVDTAELNIYEPPRFFEAFLRGRSYSEPPDITARICGICPVAYQVSACNAIENACGVTVDPELVALRRLLYCGEWIHSHVLHIYLLHAPDFLGYPDAISLAKDRREFIERGLALKKAGNQLMQQLGGRAIHPINVRLGGFYAVPTPEELKPLAELLRRAMDDALYTVRAVAEFEFPDFIIDHELLALTDADHYAIEDGVITRAGGPAFTAADFLDHVTESQVPHSTALHATLDGHRYLTGPMARYSLNSAALSPIAHQAAAEGCTPGRVRRWSGDDLAAATQVDTGDRGRGADGDRRSSCRARPLNSDSRCLISRQAHCAGACVGPLWHIRTYVRTIWCGVRGGGGGSHLRGIAGRESGGRAAAGGRRRTACVAGARSGGL